MVRRYAEPVQVQLRLHLGSDGSDGSVGFDPELEGGAVARPESFRWRGRDYAVRAVLGHWRERRAWWREALDPPPGVPHGVAAAARERLVWRVEAGPGRSLQTGVFDLCCDEIEPEPLSVPGATLGARWQLLRVTD